MGSVSFLVVDQSQESQDLWRETLASVHPEAVVESALNAEAALEFAAEKKSSLIIASWELEPVSCLVFMQKLRALPKNMHTPFLIFAGNLSEQHRQLAREFDIPDVMLAPFDEKRVAQKTKEILDAESEIDPVLKSLRKIEVWLMEDRVNEALSLITSCLKKGPYAAKAYTLYGDIWRMADKFEQAEKAYKNALNFDPEYSKAITGVGKCYLKLGNFEEAMKIFEGLQKKVPGNISRIVTMGQAYLDKGDDDKARELFEKAQGIDKDNGDAKAGLGKVEFNAGNMDAASKLFKDSGKGDEIASYYNGMAIALVNQSKFKDAIKLYRDALAVVPKNNKESLLLFNIGLAYKKDDDFPQAVESFARSLIAGPNNKKALSALVFCAKQSEERGLEFDKKITDRAIKAYKEAQKSVKMAS